jgi:Fe-S oxidoreductase
VGHRIDNYLRWNFSAPVELPFQPRLAFAFKDGSFIGNLEQCNGCGGCRKDAPIMCPTFLATGEEVMSTRGRANIIRRALEMRSNGGDPLRSAELDAALSNCLSCKGCTPECPSNVNLALLKAEMLHARWRRDGLPLQKQFFSHVDLLGRLGCTLPRLSNAMINLRPLRLLLQKTLGISAKRSLPRYADERFDRWFARRMEASADSGGERFRAGASTKKVILWDDTFVRYHEPQIGLAAVKVLEALGFEVELIRNRRCCGRPAFSQGHLDLAARLGEHNISQVSKIDPQFPIVFLEPSCWSMLVEDYRELKIPNAAEIASRCFLFERFIDDVLANDSTALRNLTEILGQVSQDKREMTVAIHAHCHAKSILDPAFMARLVEKIPGMCATLLNTGCCGMAGAFGALEEKYGLSRQVAADLIAKLDESRADVVVASGTSCRHQISDLTNYRPMHMAELIASAIISE